MEGGVGTGANKGTWTSFLKVGTHDFGSFSIGSFGSEGHEGGEREGDSVGERW